MKSDEIKVGSVYRIKHNGQAADVKVLSIFGPSWAGPTTKRKYFRCLKLSTKRDILVKSATRFEREIYEVETGEVA